MFFSVPKPVILVMDRLESAGFPAYLVGGCVRDDLLGIPPHDYDVTTAARPDEIKAVFAEYPLILSGEKHGTVAVILSKDTVVEITAFRVDGEYADGRHPNGVRFTRDIRADLSRRDFTVNAMAWRRQEGLVDPFGGQADCNAGIIRCVGEPEKRLTEDALRILRALRFAACLGFRIEPETAFALHRLRERTAPVSRERIAAELTGLLAGRYSAHVLREYADVLRAAVPEMSLNAPSERALSVLERLDRRTQRLTWAALLTDEAPETAENVLRGLKLSGALIRDVPLLLSSMDAPPEPSSVLPLLHTLDTALFDDLMTLLEADGQAVQPLRAEKKRVLDEGLCYTLKGLHLHGDDLLRLGYAGESIGRELNSLLARVMAGELENHEAALKRQAERDLCGDYSTLLKQNRNNL